VRQEKIERGRSVHEAATLPSRHPREGTGSTPPRRRPGPPPRTPRLPPS